MEAPKVKQKKSLWWYAWQEVKYTFTDPMFYFLILTAALSGVVSYLVAQSYTSSNTERIIINEPSSLITGGATLDGYYQRENAHWNAYKSNGFPPYLHSVVNSTVELLRDDFGSVGPVDMYYVADNGVHDGYSLTELETIYCNNIYTGWELMTCYQVEDWHSQIVTMGNPFVQRFEHPFLFIYVQLHKVGWNAFTEEELKQLHNQIAIHEYFHLYALSWGNYNYSYAGGPRWWLEGVSDFMGRYLPLNFPEYQIGYNTTREDYITFFQNRRTSYDAITDIVTIEQGETNAEHSSLGSYQFTVIYQGGSLAAMYCFWRNGDLYYDRFMDFFNLQYQYGWEYAFKYTCNVHSLADFYSLFADDVANATAFQMIIDGTAPA